VNRTDLKWTVIDSVAQSFQFSSVHVCRSVRASMFSWYSKTFSVLDGLYAGLWNLDSTTSVTCLFHEQRNICKELHFYWKGSSQSGLNLFRQRAPKRRKRRMDTAVDLFSQFLADETCRQGAKCPQTAARAFVQACSGTHVEATSQLLPVSVCGYHLAAWA